MAVQKKSVSFITQLENIFDFSSRASDRPELVSRALVSQY